MSLQDNINQALRHHAPVSELRKLAQLETTSQIARENETSHANAMDVRSIMSALSSLVDRTNSDPLAKKLALQQEMEELELTHAAMGRLIRDLQS
jgi:hypothetical protein